MRKIALAAIAIIMTGSAAMAQVLESSSVEFGGFRDGGRHDGQKVAVFTQPFHPDWVADKASVEDRVANLRKNGVEPDVSISILKMWPQ